MSVLTLFAPIVKSEKDPVTGHLTIYGKMTGSDLDLDQQICDEKWLSKAVPQWFETGANVRYMHQADAVGVGQMVEQDGTDWYLKSLIVDAPAIEKIEAKVLTGYSVGIKDAKVIKDAAAPNGRICGGMIIETSVVDRPALPTAKFVLAKVAKDELAEVGEWITKDLATSIGVSGDVTDDTGTSSDTTADAGDEVDEMNLVAMIRAALQALLVSEAQEVAEGEGTTDPVRLVIWLLEDLAWYEACDAYDDATSLAAMKTAQLTEGDLMKLATLADIMKTATGDAATDDDKAQLVELHDLLGVTKAVDSAAAAEAKATVTEETVKGLVADLAKARAELDAVKEMAAPGGPIRIRTEMQTVKAAHAERAAAYDAKALAIDDPSLREGYRQLAEQARAAATLDA